MNTEPVRQTSFFTGEVDETVWKRTEIDEYLTAAQSLKNMEIATTGLAKKRKGTRKDYDVTAYAIPQTRMYELVDKVQNHYLLSASDNVISVFQYLNGAIIFIQNVATPYTAADIEALDYTQANDSVVFTHPLLAPGRIYISVYGSPSTFAFEFLNIYPYPAFDFNTINYNNFTVSLAGSTATNLIFEFVGVGANPGFDASWIGGQIVGGGLSDVDPIGYAIIDSVSYSAGGGGTVTFLATVQIQFELDAAKYAKKGSQYTIKKPAWSASLGYPAKCLFMQNRLWLASTATLPTTIFGSKINAPINFDVGTGKDNDAIVYSVGLTNSGSITWLNGGKQLEVFTKNLETACPQSLETALTPNTFTVRQQSSFGSATALKPITYINDTYLTSKTGKSVINYHFNGVGLTYQSRNISAASHHLVKNPFNRALMRGSDTSQDNFIYFANPDHTMTAFQFASETKLAALTPIEFQEDVEVIDIVTIDNTVFILKKYNLTNKYILESFNENVKMDGYRSASMNSSGVITGLDDLKGYTATVIFDNQDFGDYLVDNTGTIEVRNPLGLSGTATVGLLYDCEVIPMYIYGGKLASPFFKKITRIYVDYYNSLDLYIDGKLVNYQTFAEIQSGNTLSPKTGTAIVDPKTGYGRFSTFSITQSSPFDFQVLGIAYQIKKAVI